MNTWGLVLACTVLGVENHQEGWSEGVGLEGWALRFDNLDPLNPTLCLLTTDWV